MSPNPRRGTPSGDAALAIQRLARRTGADVQELQTLYVLEAFLARVAASGHRDDLVLKGGVLLAVFELRRPTRDIDFQARGISNDVAAVEGQLQILDDSPGHIRAPWHEGVANFNQSTSLPASRSSADEV